MQRHLQPLNIRKKNIINLKPNGKPRTTAIDAMIVLIQKFVTDNSRLTVRQIAKLLVVELSSGTVYAALIEYLILKRHNARWRMSISYMYFDKRTKTTVCKNIKFF